MMTMFVLFVTICILIFTLALFYPKIWSSFLPPALLPICCFTLLLYISAYILFRPNIDPAFGINEYFQDHISRKHDGFNKFISEVKNDMVNLKSDQFYDKYGFAFSFVAPRGGMILSKVRFHYNGIALDKTEIAWNKQISFSPPSCSEMLFLLFDFYRVVFFYLVAIFIILIWKSCRNWIISSSNFIIIIMRILQVAAFSIVGLYFANKMLPITEYDASVNPKFDMSKLLDPELTDEMEKIFHAETTKTDNPKDLRDRIGVYRVFVATDESLSVPHIRWNGNLFEYYFFIPAGYSPENLNPYLTWNNIHGQYWHARYWRYSIAIWLNQIINYGLFFASFVVIVYYAVSFLKMSLAKNNKHII